MRQNYYDFIRQTHEHQFEVARLHQMVKTIAPENPILRKRSLLYMSDMLLNLGQRIRPTEFQVHVHDGRDHDGTLEITAKGC